MQRDKYETLSDSAHENYEFLSCGPRGKIKKVVRYTKFQRGSYNIGFGDWDYEMRTISDDVRTNNNDRDKVLATVAFTIFEFLEYHPSAIILAEGNTPARNRLYQIEITANLPVIEKLFVVEGYYKGKWEAFRKGRNYQAFSFKAKEKL